MTSPNNKDGMQPAGGNSILPKEHGSKFYPLPVVKNSDKDVRHLAADFFLFVICFARRFYVIL
jgi:kinesin family protein 13